LNNITAGVREPEEANRTRVAGHLDEIQGVVANTLKLYCNGVIGFIDWLDVTLIINMLPVLQSFQATAAGANIQIGTMNVATDLANLASVKGTRRPESRAER
jgi:hypothetical protein